MFKSGDEALVRVLDIDFNRQRVQMDIDSVSVDEQMEWMQTQHKDESELSTELSDTVDAVDAVDNISQDDIQTENDAVDAVDDISQDDIQMENDAVDAVDDTNEDDIHTENVAVSTEVATVIEDGADEQSLG
jgi:hypothetical protein